jgi:putative pyruvate formate lyase activating enzyme
MKYFLPVHASDMPGAALSNIAIWQDAEMRAALGWYRRVADNLMPAKFRLARCVPVEISLTEASEEVLWQELKTRTLEFLSLWHEIRHGERDLPETLDGANEPDTGEGNEPDTGRANTPATTIKSQPNLLNLCRELSQRILSHCNFCRWDCQVDRRHGPKLGTCKLAGDTRVSTFFHHQGEELIYRGRMGSGTIFFTSCNMRCAFCQNGDISTDKDNGEAVTPRALATMAWLLRKEGCHNVNWVGGEVTIHLHTIVEAISLLANLEPTDEDLRAALPAKNDFYRLFRYDSNGALNRGVFNAPMLWNSNFFMSAESMKILRLLIDVWLPDFKFGPGRCAVTLSKTPWYWETVTGNLKMIYDWGEDFTIRHLVMPNHVECCTRPVLEWVADNMPDAPVNIMDQYHPDNFCDRRSPKYREEYVQISRRPTSREILEAFRYAKELSLNFESLSYEKNTTGLRL